MKGCTGVRKEVMKGVLEGSRRGSEGVSKGVSEGVSEGVPWVSEGFRDKVNLKRITEMIVFAEP